MRKTVFDTLRKLLGKLLFLKRILNVGFFQQRYPIKN